MARFHMYSMVSTALQAGIPPWGFIREREKKMRGGTSRSPAHLPVMLASYSGTNRAGHRNRAGLDTETELNWRQ